MGCSSCGNHHGSSSACTCKQRAMDVVTPLESIRNGDENFCFTEVNDEICKNLANDEGIHPSVQNSNTDCDDLSSLNDLATGSLNNSLIELDPCDTDGLKCWLLNLISWNWNMFKAIICAICGIWCNVHNLIDNVKTLFKNDATQQQEIECLMNALKGLYTGNIETSFNVRSNEGNLPGGSQGGSFTKDGSFTLFNDEVVPDAGIRTTINGKVNYSSRSTDDGIVFNIESIYIDKIIGRLVNGGYNDLMSTKVTVNGQTVFDSGGQNIPLNQPFDFNIQKTFALNKQIEAAPGSDTGFLDIINLIQQNIIGGTDIDNVWGQIRFKNNNNGTAPDCLQDLEGYKKPNC